MQRGIVFRYTLQFNVLHKHEKIDFSYPLKNEKDMLVWNVWHMASRYNLMCHLYYIYHSYITVKELTTLFIATMPTKMFITCMSRKAFNSSRELVWCLRVLQNKWKIVACMLDKSIWQATTCTTRLVISGTLTFHTGKLNFVYFNEFCWGNL